MQAGVTIKKGLDQVRELNEHRAERAEELRYQGKKVVGYFCAYAPAELMTAAGVVPFRITGDVREPITQADAYLETIMCPFIRSCFDMAIKGRYDFLDGLVVPHSCDTVERIYTIWQYNRRPEYSHFINVPHIIRNPASHRFFKAELGQFQKSLERYTGTQISAAALREAVALHNENRTLLRELSRLRREDPPLLTGTEMLQVLIAGMTIPADEYRGLLKEVIAEVRGRAERPPTRAARVLVYGAELDDASFIELIEGSGANVVIDDLCVGTRNYWDDIAPTDDPLDGITSYYLEAIRCPRTYRDTPGSHEADLESRYRYLMDFIDEFKVNGVISYVFRFCDTHEFDLPEVRDYLESQGVPFLHLEEDYDIAAAGRLKTRIQAFLEMIG